MKFIDKCRLLTKIKAKRNMKSEYKRALRAIKFSAVNGNSSTKFNIALYYENKDDIYAYITDKLKSKGFKVAINRYGWQNSHILLHISWGK